MPSKLFKRLVYIYVGTTNYDADHNFYKNILGAPVVWEFKKYGARVAAFDFAGEPYILLADHIHAPGKRLIYEVDNLVESIKTLEKKGWKADGKQFEVPDGPCINFSDESGNEYALLEMKRPRILEK